MQPSLTKFTIKIKGERNDVDALIPSSIGGEAVISGTTTSAPQECKIGEQIDINAPAFQDQEESNLLKPAEATSLEKVKDNSSDDDDQDCSNAQNQLVVYNPPDGASDDVEFSPDAVPINFLTPPQRSQLYNLQNSVSRNLPSVGAFTVQCAKCFKWRLIPSKEKYEEIREHILEQPFVCEAAREWRPEISCDDDPDIRQDGSRLWAIDRPNIAQAPLGWERLLRIRGFGGTKFADVYYVTPSGKRLRSMVEVQRYLLEHPDEAEGVALSQFSFQIPRPLQENYVKKRTPRLTFPDGSTSGTPGSSQARPLSWSCPEANTDLQLGMLDYGSPYQAPVVEPPSATYQSPLHESIDRPAKRSKQPSGQMYNGGYTYMNLQQDEGRRT
ncbi:methyl-CpG-binding domain-containing protein 2 [Heracleum sosnowskyi]|uniref:Methyl-CpG-binding domain-containing protein 2 n=1 Tax=Heracleum sosnowskyi TaxID=360622 RepID=A0AAD8HHK2_9APIA|nr:methyl-CpG-binding domain-containing protein 2 [Heracleum sosnowskyi]